MLVGLRLRLLRELLREEGEKAMIEATYGFEPMAHHYVAHGRHVALAEVGSLLDQILHGNDVKN